jgi:hypothetical protein
MSLPKDFDPTLRHSENVVMSPEARAEWQAQQDIENHIKDATQDSALWKAFADYTDYEEINYLMRPDNPVNIGRNESPYKSQSDLINETIRQRTNEVTSYNRHFDKAEELGGALEDAIKANNKSLDDKSVLETRVIRFIAIKNRAIDRFDQQSETPPNQQLESTPEKRGLKSLVGKLPPIARRRT